MERDMKKRVRVMRLSGGGRINLYDRSEITGW
jgi:hypothetical protein